MNLKLRILLSLISTSVLAHDPTVEGLSTCLRFRDFQLTFDFQPSLVFILGFASKT
jgi:hypothetical protein